MKIIIDAMGGDNAPYEIVKGAVEAQKEFGVDIALVGRIEDILKVFESEGIGELPAGIEIVNAGEVITMEDDPASAARTKRDSSMSVALKLLGDGNGDAVVSAGSTGALLSGATLYVKRIRGIRRAALAPVIPGKGGTLIVDVGANVECSPEYLLQFAYMGSFYMRKMYGIDRPRVALLNIGAEEAKGDALRKEAFSLLKEAGREGRLNFIGNAEAREVMNDSADVLVTDGFSGNILLKAVEGVALFFSGELKNMFMAGTKTKLAALLVKDGLTDIRKRFDYAEIGGTALIGIAKPVIKAHGSSNAYALRSAIKQAIDFAASGIIDDITENLEFMKIPAEKEAENSSQNS